MEKVITYPAKNLRKPCSPYEGKFDNSPQKTAKIMFKIMEKNNGIGLSANQIGLNICMSVVDIRLSVPEKDRGKFKPLILINPKIVKKSQKKEKMEEGCLSVPNLYGQVERSEKIKIEYQNQFGKKNTLKAEELLSRVIQHEIDHLNGVLFIDKVEPGTLREVTPEDICRDLNIIFIGTSSFGLPILEELVKNKIIPKLIITEPAKKAGRSKKLVSTPIKNYAEKFHFNTAEPEKILNAKNKIKEINPDFIIVAAYGQIIPKSILNIPKLGCLNIHPSILPKYRGPSPIASAILNREKETGITIILMDEKIDHGPIIDQKKIKIDDPDTTPILEDKLAKIGAVLTIKVINKFNSGPIKLRKQNERLATVTKKFIKENGKINWQEKPEIIDAKVRAFVGWPGTYTEINGKRLIIKKTHLEDKKLYIDEVQPEGKNKMNFADFLRGAPYAVDFFKKIKYNHLVKE